MEARRIDRLLLVDYNSETVLFEPDASASAFAVAVWRFSVGPVPAPPVEPLSSEARFLAEASAASETLATPIKVPANVTAASIVTQTMPEYPEKARAGRIQGEVVLHAIIDKEGKISEVQILSGDDVLAQSAVEAVRQWRYKPMLVDGEVKEVDTTITLTFSLKD
jgi:TonB family protein